MSPTMTKKLLKNFNERKTLLTKIFYTKLLVKYLMWRPSIVKRDVASVQFFFWRQLRDWIGTSGPWRRLHPLTISSEPVTERENWPSATSQPPSLPFPRIFWFITPLLYNSRTSPCITTNPTVGFYGSSEIRFEGNNLFVFSSVLAI